MRSFLPRASRAFDTVQPIAAYRPVGRRPSLVYVDDSMTAATPTPTAHRLNDRVYHRMTIEVGSQIQERDSGFALVNESGDCGPIQLSAPRSLEQETAFTHALRALDADRLVIAELLAAGVLVDATPRRVKRWSPPSDKMFAASDPLIVDPIKV